MKQALLFTILLSAALFNQSLAQDVPIFPKGEKAANIHHTGNVWLHELVKADPVLDIHISVATPILVDRFCLLQMVLAITRKKASQNKLFIKER